MKCVIRSVSALVALAAFSAQTKYVPELPAVSSVLAFAGSGMCNRTCQSRLKLVVVGCIIGGRQVGFAVAIEIARGNIARGHSHWRIIGPWVGAVAMSGIPSPLKSPVAKELGDAPVE